MAKFPSPDLQYFVGKICSIFTKPVQRDFRLEGPNYLQQLLQYFLGTVESIDEYGMLLTQRTGLKIYIFREHLIAIAEEEVLDPEKPKDAEVIKAIENPPPVIDVEIPNFLSVDALSNMANNLKKNFGK
jgi:hypothetical protein